MHWWEENALYDLKAGDLVKLRNRNEGVQRTFLVVSVSPEKTCKVNTVQYAKVVRTSDGTRLSFASKKLINCHKERRNERR
jgi:hypothetical protein